MIHVKLEVDRISDFKILCQDCRVMYFRYTVNFCFPLYTFFVLNFVMNFFSVPVICPRIMIANVTYNI